MKVSVNTSAGTESSAHANPDVSCFQDALWGLITRQPNALSCSRSGPHDAALQGAEDPGQGVQPCCCGECCFALSSVCWCVVRSRGEALEPVGEGTPLSANRSQRPELPSALLPDISAACRCLVPSMGQDLMCCLLLLLSSATHWIEQGRVKYRQIERLVVFIFDMTPFI